MNKKFVSEGSLMFFLDSYLKFRYFKWNFDLIFEVLLKFYNPMA